MTLRTADPRGVLTQTLTIWFDENCDLPQAAARLNIHINTLRYRLTKIEQLTQLKINELNSLLRLYLGMLIHG